MRRIKRRTIYVTCESVGQTRLKMEQGQSEDAEDKERMKQWLLHREGEGCVSVAMFKISKNYYKGFFEDFFV